MARNDDDPTPERKPVRFAELGDVGAFAEGLSDAYLMCREMGHLWKPFSAWWNAEERCYSRTLRCTRCKTDREQLLSSQGAIVSSHYDYPDGYQREGLGRISGLGRDRLRLETMTRLIKDKEN
jgi:hypothetical protein